MIVDDFIWRAAVAGCLVACLAGPLGGFVVWRRLAYFGDTLSHAGLLGVALGLLAGIDPMIGVAVVAAALAVALALMMEQRIVGGDAILGILSHGGLAFGLLAMSFAETVRVDLLSYLFGDILAVTVTDIGWLAGGTAVGLAVIVGLWRRLLAVTVDEDLARVEGLPVSALRVVFMLCVALMVAMAMKVVGVLLITALLIIPAATARRFSTSPEGMAMLAAGLGCASVIAGLASSYLADLPAGPAIVAVAALLFLASSFGLRRG